VVRLLSDPGKPIRHHQRSTSVPDSPSRGSERIAFGSYPAEGSLRWLDEWDQHPRRVKEKDPYEHERGGGSAVLLLLLRMLHGTTMESANDEQKDVEYDSSSVECPSTTNADQGQRRNACF